jgi:3-hydroxybenzoate 6-monooxygenase
MMDAVDGSEVGSFPVGQAFRDRFKNPYAVIHRADIHTSMLEATQGSNLIHVETSTKVISVSQDDQGVTAVDQNGRIFKADALVAADGVRSVIREKTVQRSTSHFRPRGLPCGGACGRNAP